MINKAKAVVPFWILWSGLIAINVVVLIITIVSACLLNNSINDVFEDKQKFVSSTKKYQSYYNTMTGVELQNNEIPSWVYSAVSFAEASYRKNGYEKGFLSNKEYVRFDKSIFYATLKKLCASKPSKYCDTVANNGSPELFYYLYTELGDDFVKALSPIGYSEDLSKNPISFEVESVGSFYTRAKLKSLMSETGLPATLSFGRYLRRYSVPCNNSIGYTCPDSLTKVSCPSEIGGDCVSYTFKEYSNSGVYDYVGDLHYNTKHSVLVVGYNDEKRIDRSWGVDNHNFHDGGYVVKNIYGYQHGHSMRYWLQQHSIKEEMQLCPNVESYEQWTPLDETCYDKYGYSYCASLIIKKGVKNYINDTITKLKCSSQLNTKYQGIFTCDENRIYVLAAKKHSFGPYSSYDSIDVSPVNFSNMFKVKLFSFNENMTDKQTLYISPTCPEMLEEIFDAHYSESDLTAVTNTEECGYDFIPYRVLDQYNQHYVVDGLHAPAFSMFQINWKDVSYAKSKTSNVDYSGIVSATKEVVQTNFTGPLEMN
ncbi:Uncharacterized protein QTN25_009077 [Entamoeba marina]